MNNNIFRNVFYSIFIVLLICLSATIPCVTYTYIYMSFSNFMFDASKSHNTHNFHCNKLTFGKLSEAQHTKFHKTLAMQVTSMFTLEGFLFRIWLEFIHWDNHDTQI